MAQDKIKSLYETFIKEGYNMESEPEFRKNLEDPNKRRAAYDALVSDGYDMEAFDQFESNIGYASASTPALASQAQTQQPAQSVAEPARRPADMAAGMVANMPVVGGRGVEERPGASAAPMAEAAARVADAVGARIDGRLPSDIEEGAGVPGDGFNPTEPDKIRMLHGVESSMEDFRERTDKMAETGSRARGEMTAEGKAQARAAEFQARFAGTPTRVMGFTPAASTSDEDAMPVDGDVRQKPLMSGKSPVPHGVKIVNGKQVTEWLLPDGRLTTDLLEADKSEYIARGSRREHQFERRMEQNGLGSSALKNNREVFERRMRENNLDPNKQEDVDRQLAYDVQTQIGLDAQSFAARLNDSQINDTISSLWEEAEFKQKADIEQGAKKNWDGFSVMGGGREMRIVTTAADRYDRDKSHLTRFDLQAMMDDMWKRYGKALSDDCYEQLARRCPGMNQSELRSWAEGLARQITDDRVYQYAVGKNTPKSTLEYFGRQAAGMNLVNSISKGIARMGAGGKIGDLTAYETAMGEYGKRHRVAQVGATVFGMAVDPTTWVAGGVGSIGARSAVNVGGRIVAGRAANGMARQVGSRIFTSTLGGKAITGAAGGASNLATYEMMKEGERQFVYGGVLNPETLEVGDYSAGDVLKAGMHGLVMGGVTGTFSPIIGNVADKTVRGITSTAGKAGVRFGEVAVSTLAEGTVFSIPEWISGEGDAFDVWTDNMAMMIGFKAQHGLKSAPRVVAGLRPIKEPKTQAERNHNRQSFEERINKTLDEWNYSKDERKAGYKLEFTKADREELRRAGYGELADLFGKSEVRETKPEEGAVDFQRVEPETGRIVYEGQRKTRPIYEGIVDENGRTTYTQFGEEIIEDVKQSFKPTNPEFDGYSAMERLMEDGRVSEATRAKAYYILSGRMLPMSSVVGWNMTTNEDGSIIVNSMNAQGGVVTSRVFKNKGEADAEASRIQRQAELNTIDIGEQFREAEANGKVFDAAINEVSPGADPTNIKEIYDKVKRGDKDVTEDKRVLAEFIDEAIDRNMDAGKANRPDNIRAEIKEATGADVDAALRKRPSDRTEVEQEAVQTYMERLYPEETRQTTEQPTPEQQEARRAYESAKLLYGRFEAGTPEVQAEARADMDAIVLRYREALEGIEDAFGADAEARMAEIHENPWDLLTNPELTVDQQDAVLYYINSRAALDGVQDAADESTDRKREAVTKAVNDRTHKDAGVVIPATMKVDDRQVYIVKGNVVMFEDGSGVDVRNSDESVVLFDPAKGELEFASPDQIFKVGEAVDPQSELDNALAEVEAGRNVFPTEETEPDTASENIPVDGNNEGENIPVTNVEEYDRGYGDAIEEAQNLSDERLDHYVDVLREGAQKQMQENGRVDDYIRGRLEALEFVQQDRAGIAVPKTEENVPNPTENAVSDAENVPETVSTVENGQQTALQRIPLHPETGEPMFEAVDKVTAWDGLVEAVGGEKDAVDIAMAQIEQASAELETLKKKPPTPKAPKLKGSPMAMAQAKREATEKYQRDLADYNQQVADTQARMDAWNGIVGVYTSRDAELRRQREEERRQRDAEAHDAAVARFEEEQRIKAEKQAEQERVGFHTVNPKIKERWDSAPKLEGNPDAITLPDGSTIRGHYVLTEAGAASASHDVNNAYEPTEGFPIDENGQSVNDRDYQRDKDAQRIVEEMAGAYDNRALQSPIIVSKEGVVLSGNNRTMSGDLAARQGTDKAYVDYLREFGGKYGFSPEQLLGMKNPRLVFVPDEALPYDATTFSRFNAQEMKSQSKPEAAVKLGKIVPEEVFNGIVGDMARYDRLGDYYSDEKAVAHALGALRQAGVINDKQMPEVRTGTALSAAGKELIENTLIGKVFQASPDAVREIIAMPTLRQSIVMGLNEVAANRTLARSGYDLSDELSKAVELVYRAKDALPDVYAVGAPVSPFGRQQGLFDDELGESRVTDGVTLLLADMLNSGKPGDLRKMLATYNAEAASAAGGQLDLVSGAIPTKEEILTTINEHFRNATPREQQAIIDAAIAERKRQAGAERRPGAAGEQTADAVQRGAASARRKEDGSDQANPVERNGDRSVDEWFGPVYTEFQGKGEDAESYLRDKCEGVAKGALLYPGLSPIDLVWGDAKAGYMKIVIKHPEVVGQLQSILNSCKISEQSDNRAVLESLTHRIIVSKMRGATPTDNWLLTAYEKKKKPVSASSSDIETEPEGKRNGTATPQGEHSSDGKDNALSADKQIADDESFKRPTDNEKSTIIHNAVETAPEEVNPNPTEAQKRAGNYKMGHVRVDGHDISIENKKGSIRRGKDANGTQWESEMHNDYGYIRGTEGVDGDHIDVFLSDTPEQGDVFVVDQYNPDGSFDEHKVMYGFPSEDAAREAYLSNYEPGWEQTRRLDVTGVSKEVFKKWIQSSKRKTKPFAEYKSVTQIEESTSSAMTDEAVDAVVSRMKELAVVAPHVEVTDENWKPIVSTPLGEVKMGENQKDKLFGKGRADQYGMLLETLSNPNVILEERDKEDNIFHERPSSYLFIKTFQKEDGSKYVHFESVTVSQDGLEVSISSHIIRENQLRNKMKSDRLLYKATALDESANPSAEQPIKGGSLSSDSKGSQKSSDKQEISAESSKGYAITPATYTNKKGRETPMYRLEFGRELTKEEDAAVKKSASEKQGEDKRVSLEQRAVARAANLDGVRFHAVNRDRKPTWMETYNALSDSLSHVKNDTALDSPSKSDVAKLARISENLKKKAEIVGDNGLGMNELVYELAQAIEEKSPSSNKSNYNEVYIAKAGKTTIRISGHPGETERFGKTPNNVGIVIKTSNHNFRNKDDVNYVEFVYYGDKVEGNAERQRSIINGLRHYIETGSFERMPEADRLNTSGRYRDAVEGLGDKTKFRDGESEGARLLAIRGLEPIEVASNSLNKAELQEVYRNLPSVEKDGREIEFYHSAFKKIYKKGGLFGQIVPVLDQVLEQSVLAYSEKDNRGGEVRPDGSVHKYHPNVTTFDNYVGKVVIGGKEFYVRTTVENGVGQAGTHSFFVSGVEVYEKTADGLSVPNFPSGESDHQRLDNPAGETTSTEIPRVKSAADGIVDAKLRQFFERASVELLPHDMRQRAMELSEKLHTPIRLVDSADEAMANPSARHRRAKGWATDTGEIVVIVPNHSDVADIENTVVHEIVGHDGLEAMIGPERMDEFVTEVYDHAGQGIKKKIDARADKEYSDDIDRMTRQKGGGVFARAEATVEANAKKRDGHYQREATKEYMADMAGEIGDKGFERMSQEELTLWGKIKAKVQQFLDKFLRGLNIAKSIRLTDKDLAYILYKAWKHKRDGGVFSKAEDAVMRRKTGWGESPLVEISARDRASFREDAVGNKIESLFDEAIAGNLTGKPVEVGRLTAEGKNYLEKLSGMRLKDEVSFVLNPSDLVHMYRDHFGENEKDKGNNIPLTKDDIRAIANVISNPQRVIFGVEPDGLERKLFYFLAPAAEGTYNLLEIYGDRKGNLTAKTFYKTKKAVSQRVLSLMKSEHLTSVTDGASLSGAKLPKFFEYPKSDSEPRYRFRDGGLGLEETITKMKVEAAQANTDNLQAKREAMRAIGGNLNHLRQAMARQREYDISTAKSIKDLARILMEKGLLDTLGNAEVKSLLAQVTGSIGRQDISKQVDRVFEIMVDNHLRNTETAFGKLISMRTSKVDGRGIQVQGELDPDGQALLKVFNSWKGLNVDEIDSRITSTIDAMSDTYAPIAERATLEYAGLQMAREYAENIGKSKKEEKLLREEIRNAKDEKDAGRMTADAYKQFEKATHLSIRQMRLGRISAYESLMDKLGGELGESVERAKVWREAEKQRVNAIHHLANSDMQGRELRGDRPDTRLQKLANSVVARFILEPLSTFDQMLKMLGSKHPNGEGYMQNYFMRGWVDAADKEQLMKERYHKQMDDKAAEIFGTHKVWYNGYTKKQSYSYTDLYDYADSLPKVTVTYFDGAEMRKYEIGQGELLYLYAVDKMPMGRATNRRMGITDDVMQNISDALDPKLKEYADWVQEELLPAMGREMDEVHMRMFGAHMDNIENYFPFVRDTNALKREVENGQESQPNDRISVQTGAIKKRVASVSKWDMRNCNFFDVLAKHIDQDGCHWSAFAELNRDLGTLLSYNRLKQQVYGMSSVYGAGEQLWKRFAQCTAIATDAYEPKRAKFDELMVQGAKGVTMGKISFRLFTALKQTLSLPAFFGEVQPRYIAADLMTGGVQACKWAWKNMPNYRKRILSRTAGDYRLRANEYDGMIMKASSYGMLPNIGVDAWTIAVGSHGVYKTRKAKYLRWGMEEPQAERRAIQDAELCYNKSQQSSEGPFMAPVQVDHTFYATSAMLFRNSSTSYTREAHTSARNLKRILSGEVSEDYVAKQILRTLRSEGEGAWTDAEWEHTRKLAKKEIRKATIKNTVNLAMFGWILPWLWRIGGIAPLLLLSSDDDEKKRQKEDALKQSYFAPIEGLAYGDVASDALGMLTGNNDKSLYNLGRTNPFLSDIMSALKKADKDMVAASNDVINILGGMATGVNPQTITDWTVAIMDYCGDDANTSRECALLVARLLSCPQSQLDKIYFDELGADGEEASQMTPAEIAERYARYKTRRNAPLTGWAYSDEGREKQMEKHHKEATTAAKERLDKQTNIDVVKELLAEYDEVNKRETELGKLKEERRFEEYRDGMKQLRQEHDIRVHMRVKRYKRDIKELTEKYLSPDISPAEADSIVRLIGTTRVKMLEDVGRFGTQ